MIRTANQPRITDDECINKCRAAIHHRGLWMGLLLLEAKKRGADWEEIGRSAIQQCGVIHGKKIHSGMQNKNSLIDFGNTFFSEHIKKLFEIEVIHQDEEALRLEYHHCPLLTAWLDLGLEGKLLETVCDIAMCGDRGISNEFPQFAFKLGKTLAQGHSVCEVAFYRKNE